MSKIIDAPSGAAVIVILAGIVLFCPTVIAHIRHVRAFASVSALNALLLLLVVCALASLWFLWSAIVLWIPTTIWAAMGKRVVAEHRRVYCCGAKRSQQIHPWLNKPRGSATT